MKVNGIPNIRTCVTKLEEGMRVETQKGKGAAKIFENSEGAVLIRMANIKPVQAQPPQKQQ